MTRIQNEILEYARLALYSQIISVKAVQKLLYDFIEKYKSEELHVLEAAAVDEQELILLHLASVKFEYKPFVVEKLMAQKLLELLNQKKLKAEKIASALYLQLIDPSTRCWHKDQNTIMKLDDGFMLAAQGILNKEKLTKELVQFLQGKSMVAI